MKKVLLLFCIIISTVAFAQQGERDGSIVTKNTKDLNNFKVFPNPTMNDLTVSFGKLTEGISFNISDALGKLIYSRRIVSYDLQKNSFKLDMSSFQDGVYTFSFKTKTASKIIKVVKL